MRSSGPTAIAGSIVLQVLLPWDLSENLAGYQLDGDPVTNETCTFSLQEDIRISCFQKWRSTGALIDASGGLH